MKMKMKFGNIKFTYEGVPKNLIDSNILQNNLFRNNAPYGMLPNFNPEFVNKMYGSLPKNLKDYLGSLNNFYEDYLRSVNTAEVNSTGDSVTLHANGHDIYNYVARFDLANYQIQAILKLDGHLNFNKLAKAVKLSIDAQPVFGCRFVEGETPYWKRIDKIDKKLLCSLEETENPDEAIQRFLDSPLDMDHDLMVKVKLIQSDNYDTVCIKTNHACCDGAGTKEYISLLTEIYSIIDQDFGIFIPKPRKRSRKDQDRLFDGLGISDPEKEWIPGSEITKATWPFQWTQVQSDIIHNVVLSFPEANFGEMHLFAKANNATINDLILTAYYRAMIKATSPKAEEIMEIPITIDLRRYLPDHKTESIRNFSGSEFTRLAVIPDETFSETLARVVPMMNDIKSSRPGLQSAIGLERVEKMTFSETVSYYKLVAQWPYYCSDKCSPVLSNLGVMSDNLLKFGKMAVTDAYIVPPTVRAPGLLLMVSTYNGIMTLSAGYYEASMPAGVVEALLHSIKNELTQECRL